ncbi:AbrB/MazE/SpoVT family DNA-binding domain-containing protein [Testudinibacter sp. TR-2022]|uniref:antitoxin n=1 Tax=Testudinibacter sp. TR-2022 TaxID=2585029 RepID=UPI00111B8BED|nr:AbrB/MazE/SpoVT family DNA-binding domain-containing protein [Testudinibacter sp. TR-2022]TNH02573.1 AbrB/MazE/SpoVT family DNA-binding domain-containing protein [Pasteurellaceae bacterium Phil31]TNH08381.1 AbrB/MazE/SpoVT family DNA-binding domain-containing protein [Testudinibacter sp. TR-2022]TNH09150.1 AbrB/MazE/SpoVT family DNA-binding domain-containing protein [Testudinibacter sp. TR-2022]TNH12862.1 AbrB/MazE/SpoVT family DNA-binding domain-containing protein [Testudinibacter sp. TR-20
MERIVSIFRNGRNQAVRLPVDFEFNVERVYIHREKNGDVVLSPYSSREKSWHKLLTLLEKDNFDDFLSPAERNQDVTARDPFNWID